MKSYFIIGAKILGIYLFYLCLLSLYQAVTAIVVFTSSASEPFTTLTMVSSIGSLIILLVLSVLLLFKTEMVATILKVEDSESNSSQKVSVQAGIILIGVYVFSTHIGRFLATLYFQIKVAKGPMGTLPEGLIFSKDLTTASITIAFSILLVFGSKTVADFIHKVIQKDDT